MILQTLSQLKALYWEKLQKTGFVMILKFLYHGDCKGIGVDISLGGQSCVGGGRRRINWRHEDDLIMERCDQAFYMSKSH